MSPTDHEPAARAASRSRTAVLLAALSALAGALLGGRLLHAWWHLPQPDRVGACGFGPTCRDTTCHFTFPEGSTTLTYDLHQESPTAPLPAAYVPGAAYPLRLDLFTTDAGVARLGFQLAALVDCPAPTAGGTLVSLEPLRAGVVPPGSPIPYLAHACPCGTGSLDPTCCGVFLQAVGTNGWSFEWTAPARGTGDVTFYMAFNEANGDDAPGFDRISIGRATVSEEQCPPPIEDLRLRRADCDGGSPGDELELSWTPVSGGPSFVRSTDLAGLPSPRQTWTLEPGACLPLDPRPLVFYSVAETCELGSEGVH